MNGCSTIFYTLVVKVVNVIPPRINLNLLNLAISIKGGCVSSSRQYSKMLLTQTPLDMFFLTCSTLQSIFHASNHAVSLRNDHDSITRKFEPSSTQKHRTTGSSNKRSALSHSNLSSKVCDIQLQWFEVEKNSYFWDVFIQHLWSAKASKSVNTERSWEHDWFYTLFGFCYICNEKICRNQLRT